MDEEFKEIPVKTETRPEILEIREIEGLENHFNAAVWWRSSGEIALLARFLNKAAEWGEADKGRLVLDYIPTELIELGLMNDKVIEEEQVWDPEGKQILLEDPRALVLRDGRILIGLTAVRKNELGEVIPEAALMYLKSRDQVGQIQETDYQIIKNLGPGKNFTPVDSETFLYRKEGDENNHKIHVIGWNEATRQAIEKGVIEMPNDLDWASYRTGTTMPPIWLNEKEALMIFHGIKKVEVVQANGEKKYRYDYALGKAILRKDENGRLYVNPEEVGREPILTRDDIRVNGKHIEGELHPERRVVYCCGGVLEKRKGRDVLDLFVNVGDIKTMKVRFGLEELIKGLRRPDLPNKAVRKAA